MSLPESCSKSTVHPRIWWQWRSPSSAVPAWHFQSLGLERITGQPPAKMSGKKWSGPGSASSLDTCSTCLLREPATPNIVSKDLKTWSTLFLQHAAYACVPFCFFFLSPFPFPNIPRVGQKGLKCLHSPGVPRSKGKPDLFTFMTFTIPTIVQKRTKIIKGSLEELPWYEKWSRSCEKARRGCVVRGVDTCTRELWEIVC